MPHKKNGKGSFINDVTVLGGGQRSVTRHTICGKFLKKKRDVEGCWKSRFLPWRHLFLEKSWKVPVHCPSWHSQQLNFHFQKLKHSQYEAALITCVIKKKSHQNRNFLSKVIEFRQKKVKISHCVPHCGQMYVAGQIQPGLFIPKGLIQLS
jgi:hypothetical protein